MTGIQVDWFTDPKTVGVVVACVFPLALAIRVFAGFLVQRLLRTNRRKRHLRYRIPLTLVHPKRPGGSRTATAVPIQEEGPRSAAANRRAQ